MRLPLLFLAALALTATQQAGGAADESAFELLPDRPRVGERLACGATRLYHVQGLRLGAAYDVKLSYPATVPTEFALEVRHVLGVYRPCAAATDGPRRRVLNTAKLRLLPRELLLRRGSYEHGDALESFPLDLPALVDGTDASGDGAELSLVLSVRGRVEGVSRVLDLRSRECVFDIVVEELVPTVLVPRASLALVAWLALVLAAAARFVLPPLTAKIALARPEDADCASQANAERKQS